MFPISHFNERPSTKQVYKHNARTWLKSSAVLNSKYVPLRRPRHNKQVLEEVWWGEMRYFFSMTDSEQPILATTARETQKPELSQLQLRIGRRRIKTKNRKMQKLHRVRMPGEMRLLCRTWLIFVRLCGWGRSRGVFTHHRIQTSKFKSKEKKSKTINSLSLSNLL